MRSLEIEPVFYNKAYNLMMKVFVGSLIIACLYLFLLLTSSSNALTLKTLLTIVITFLLTAAIPYCAFRILENANKKDQNNALIKLEEQIQEIYKVKFKRKPAVNTVSIFVKENGEKFYGVVVINDDQEPVLKVLKEYI